MQRELTLDLEFALVRGASAQPSWAKSADGDDKNPVFIHYEFTAPQGVSGFPPHTLLHSRMSASLAHGMESAGSLFIPCSNVACRVGMRGRAQH
jgi:hypothetical protein